MKWGKDIKDRMKHHIKKAVPAKHEPLWKRIFVWLVLSGLAVIIGGMIVFAILVGVLSLGLPDVRDFDQLAGVESTIIYDREGGILYTIHGEENRKYVPIEEISPLLQQATIAIEDDGFYDHGGFDIPGITRGLIYEVFGIGTRRGGSTITQQLAKNAFLSPHQTYTRKLKELILSVRLERAYEKDKILELYLNRIPYGNNAYGAELASKIYFGKSAKDLTLGESAILASLPNKPTRYSPYGPNVFSNINRELGVTSPDEVLPKTIYDLDPGDYSVGLIGREIEFSEGNTLYIHGRSDIVLSRMHTLEFITEEEKEEALEEIQNIEFTRHRVVIRAAHFVFYVRALLEEEYGTDLVAQGGLQVFTTLDPNLQTFAEDTLAAQIETSKERHDASTGALLSVDVETGQILAMVGSADYFDIDAHGNVNHVFARRQPGSSFKPIVYAKAFLNRYSPATVIYDTPTNFGSDYRPQNYDGLFLGPMPIRRALAQSRNIPALKAYFLAGQEEEIIPFANRLGIESLKVEKSNFGPPLALGSGEVSLSEMVQAFSTFASGGMKREHYAVTKIIDRQGDTLFERDLVELKEEEVLDAQAAFLINNILSDTSINLGPRLTVPGQTVAAKTGTSNKEITPTKILPSNAWTIGYSTAIITGVWAGNSDGAPMKVTADGYGIAAPVWNKFMREALKDKENTPFPEPEGIKRVAVSKASGMLSSDQTPKGATSTEVFASYSVPTEIDTMYKRIEVNKFDNMLPNEFTPPEHIEEKLFIDHRDPITTYGTWLVGIKQWVEKKRGEDKSFPDFPPTEETTHFTAETAKDKPTIQITSPAAFATLEVGTIPVTVNFTAAHGVTRIEYRLDDRNLPSAMRRTAPYDGLVRIKDTTKPGVHTITVKIFDKLGYAEEAKIEVRVGEKPKEPEPNTTDPSPEANLQPAARETEPEAEPVPAQ